MISLGHGSGLIISLLLAMTRSMRLWMDDLPRLPVLLHSRVKGGRPRDALDALSAAFRSAVRG